jgi:uncharacterized repeat protein (TIGR03803 family)
MSGNQLWDIGGRQIAVARTFGCLVSVVLSALVVCGPANAAKLEVLHEFTGPDGSDPQGGLTIDVNTGTLYGTAIYGGTGFGTVFSLTPPEPGKRKWKYEVIYTFEGGFDGLYPATGLAISPSGDFLWGTTLKGSSFCGGDCGTIFRLEKSFRHGWVKKTVHQFTGELYDGILPNSAPIIDGQTAYLYGTTSSSTSSTIYRMLLGDSSLTVIYNAEHHTGGYVGYHPQGVAIGSDGTIYGTAFDGEFAGTIFRIDPDGNGTILHSFGGPDGLYPLGPPVLSPGGALYGTTWEGGKAGDCPQSPGCGTVWKKLPSSKEKLLHSFAFYTHPRDGQTPLSPLALDPLTGTLYGTTYNGGTGTVCGGNGGSCGTIYSVDSEGGHYQVLWEFPKGGPAAPQGQLVFHDGALYGTSYDGGKACPDQHYIGCGTIWKLTP